MQVLLCKRSAVFKAGKSGNDFTHAPWRRSVSPHRLVLRSATAADAADNFKKQAVDAADTWKKQATETADTLKKQATDTASKVKATAAQTASQAADAVKNLKVPDMAQLDVDIKKTVIWNFLVQLVLTAVSWGIAFLTSHTSLAKGTDVHFTTGLLMVGVLLSGYSTYLSYTYIVQVKQSGLNVLQGWQQMKQFYDHLTVNFVGAAAAMVALQADVGTMMVGTVVKQTGPQAVEALAQASANTLTAHLVSLVFLTFMIRKITAAYQKVLEWGESISKSMPKL